MMRRFLFTLAILSMPLANVLAADLTLSPSTINVVAGQTFSVVVNINPREVKNYTVKTELLYPADLLEVKSFTFASNWMPLSQSGYDLVDNTNGKLIKTAGYPGGVSSVVVFGTVSFTAKKSGSGTIKVGADSLALDSSNQNVLSASPAQVSVSVTAPAPVQKQETAKPQSSPATDKIADDQAAQDEELIVGGGSEQIAEPSQSAAGITIWHLLVVSVAALIVGFTIGRKTRIFSRD